MLFDQLDDPKQMGLLQLGLGLLGGKGNFGQVVSQAGNQSLQAMQMATDRQRQKKRDERQERLLGIQEQQANIALKDAQRREELQKLPQQFLKPGMKPPTMDNIDVGAPGEQAIPAQQFDVAGYTQALMGKDPMAALQFQLAAKKDDTPIQVAAGTTLIDPHTRKPIFTNPKQHDPSSLAQLLSEFNALPPNDPRRAFYIEAIKKATTHQPATNVNVSTDKAFGTTLAEGLGKQIDTSFAAAQAAQRSIDTAHRLKGAVDSGKIVAGPGSSFRVAGLQIGQMLGVGGKDAAETLANTRTAIQSMAQAELDAAQQMKGQGQITEAERDIIRRAASGNIDSLTGPEVRQLADALEKTARWKIKGHKSNVERLKSVQGAANLLPFYQLEEPPEYTTQPSGSGVRVWDPKTRTFRGQ